MVVAARMESVLGSQDAHHQFSSFEVTCVPGPKPNVERPRARRIMVSKCSSAAVVEGEEDSSTDRDVDDEGVGRGAGR